MRGEKKRRWLMGSGIPQDQEAFGAIPLALKSLLFDGQFSIFFFFQAQCGGMPAQRWRSSGLVVFMYAAHRAVTQRPIGEGDGWHGGKRQRFPADHQRGGTSSA